MGRPFLMNCKYGVVRECILWRSMDGHSVLRFLLCFVLVFIISDNEYITIIVTLISCNMC